MDYDQLELDASYDQAYYEPLMSKSPSASPATAPRRAHVSAHRSAPPMALPMSRNSTSIASSHSKAPVFVFIHGGNWRQGAAADYGFPAEMFVAAGAHYVALDFIAVTDAAGDLP